MAVLAGILTAQSVVGVANAKLTPGLRAFAFDQYPYHDLEQNPHRVAAVSAHLPVSTTPRAIAGVVPTTFSRDFYHRIHFIPTALDLGSMFAGITRTVDVWNAFLVSKAVTSFTPPAGSGIAVTEPLAVPYTLGPIDLRVYTVTVTTDGSPVINDTLRWTIGGALYAVPITGRRVVPWPFRADWGQRIDETLEWSTGVEPAYDGTEQRVTFRHKARRSLEFATRVKGREAQHLENMLYGWNARLYGVPLWPERSRLTASAAIGASVLQCPTANRTFVAGRSALLLADDLTWEVAEIASVGASSVTLTTPVARAWGSGSALYPLLISRLEASTTVNRLTDAHVDVALRFHGSPADIDPRIPTIAAPATYQGYELYLRGTNWKNVVPFNLQSDYGLVDPQVGVYSVNRHADAPSLDKRHEWILKTADDQTAFRGWLGRRKGRAVPVWMPSGISDFTLAATTNLLSPQISVENNQFDLYGLNLPQRQHIFIRLRNGTTLARKILDATPGAGNTVTLTLDSTLGIVIAPADVKMISFLGLWRLASDAIVIGHETDSVSVVEATLRLVKP